MIIQYNDIETETEKAIKVNASVNWNEGKWHARSFWMPKSVVTLDAKHSTMEMKDWFYNKLCYENAFHGYLMDFCVKLS